MRVWLVCFFRSAVSKTLIASMTVTLVKQIALVEELLIVAFKLEGKVLVL